MQVKRKAVKFQPVTLVLEDKQDFDTMVGALNLCISLAEPGMNHDIDMIQDWVSQLMEDNIE